MSSITPLFVPMNLQALIINKDVVNSTGFNRWEANYSALLNDYNTPIPPVGVNISGGSDIDHGVHLHWILPSALTHGSDNQKLFSIDKEIPNVIESLNHGAVSSILTTLFKQNGCALSSSGVAISPTGEESEWLIADYPKGKKYLITKDPSSSSLTVFNPMVQFPKLPNRWLITRLQHSDSTLITPTSWIIQSDYLDPNSKDGKPYLDPFSDTPKTTMLGKSDLLTPSWTDPNPPELFLRAMDLGDATFTAFAPNVPNVLSFVDPMTDVPNNALVTYCITGWFSRYQDDPLFEVTPDTWDNTLKALNWKASSPPKVLPQSSLFHGITYSLKWQENGVPSRPNSDPTTISKQVKVSIGNNTIDALTALVVNQKSPSNAKVDRLMLEAFQYSLLDTLNDPGGTAEVNDAIRAGWFAPEAAGTFWDVTPAPNSKNAPDPMLYAKGMSALNSKQRELDDAYKTLKGMQKELYFRWWKGGKVSTNNYCPANPPKSFKTIEAQLKFTSPEYTDFIKQVKAQLLTVNQLAASLPNPHSPESITNYAKNVLKLPVTLQLKPTSMPRYWHPYDPVVCVSGLAPTLYSESNDPLECRFLGQLVTGLSVGSQKVDIATLKGNLPSIVSNPHIPSGAFDLINEAFFIDPNNATYIATKGLKDPGKASAIQNALTNKSWSEPTTITPAPLASTKWEQAWVPLFLEWEVLWYPTYKQDGKKQWAFDHDHWVFDGDDYNWIGSLPNTNNSETMQVFSGRTFLTTSATINFQSRLEEYLKNHPNPDLEAIDQIIKEVKGWDLLSQSLSGLYNQMIMQPIEQNFPPDASIAELVGNEYQTVPNPMKGDVDPDFDGPTPFFFPVKGGFFQFKVLRIVDRFGQVVDLLYANGNNNIQTERYESFCPIRSSRLTPDTTAKPSPSKSDEQLIEQKPGVIQPSQLNFRFVDGKNDANEVGLVDGANPVCGWLLPNHIDNALSIYDEGGIYLGSVRAVAGSQDVDWQPAPASQKPITDPKEISNTHLRACIQSLVGANKQNSFENFLSVIDETLWMVNPLGARKDQYLSALVGRPLALVRAKLELMLSGLAFSNQWWAYTFEHNDGGVSKIPFDIRLGSLEIRSDGLIGYFLDNKQGAPFSAFNAVHVPSAIGNSDQYIRPIEGSNYIPLKFNDTPFYLTMLLDPRGSVHARTGFHPVKSITLPQTFVESPLKAIEVTFRTGPIMTDSNLTQSVRIPAPSKQVGAWEWIEKADSSHWESCSIEKADSIARLPDSPYNLKDGWLQLKNTPEEET